MVTLLFVFAGWVSDTRTSEVKWLYSWWCSWSVSGRWAYRQKELQVRTSLCDSFLSCCSRNCCWRSGATVSANQLLNGTNESSGETTSHGVKAVASRFCLGANLSESTAAESEPEDVPGATSQGSTAVFLPRYIRSVVNKQSHRICRFYYLFNNHLQCVRLSSCHVPSHWLWQSQQVVTESTLYKVCNSWDLRQNKTQFINNHAVFYI